MNSLRLAVLLSIALFTLSSCGKEEEAPTSADAGDGPHNSLLSYVPAGTPYLGGNLAPAPNDVIDSFLKRLEPAAATAQAQLDELKAQMEASPDGADPASRLGLAVLHELDGKLNRAGLESLGLDLQGQQVFYGMGVFPTARVELGDAQALKATVQRVLDATGITEPQQEFQGVAYWKVAAESDPSQGKLPVSVYIAILEDHIAFSIFPDSGQTELLPLFLGLKKPDTSDAETRLKAVQSKYGYTPYFAAVADMSLLADELLSPDALFVRSAGDWYTKELAGLGDQCKSEFREIIGHTPRLVMGSTELTANAIGMQYVVETQPDQALQLIGLLADVPMGTAASNRLLEFAFGLKVGAVRDFLLAKATAVTASPYQCEQLQDLNAQATATLAKLNEPLPPLVNNFRGLRLSLNQLSMGQSSVPEAAAGLLAVHVDQPELFVGMAQMFLPDLSSLKLVKGEPPVQLPQTMIPLADTVAFAALTESAIGIAMGADEEKALVPYLEQSAATNGTFLSVSYDSAAYLDFTSKLQDGLEEFTEQADETADPEAGQQGPVKTVSEAMRQAYANAVDRSQIDARFTEQGLLIDSRMTFK
ncbi:MAG: hypothetical protein EXR85_05380 [Xanthomonadales bacterium]|nr:hypothetical protein [Xanthomonadales bacterium]